MYASFVGWISNKENGICERAGSTMDTFTTVVSILTVTGLLKTIAEIRVNANGMKTRSGNGWMIGIVMTAYMAGIKMMTVHSGF